MEVRLKLYHCSKHDIAIYYSKLFFQTKRNWRQKVWFILKDVCDVGFQIEHARRGYGPKGMSRPEYNTVVILVYKVNTVQY